MLAFYKAKVHQILFDLAPRIEETWEGWIAMPQITASFTYPSPESACIANENRYLPVHFPKHRTVKDG